MFYDRPAGVNMKRIKELGITDADLCYHYVWITGEWGVGCWGCCRGCCRCCPCVCPLFFHTVLMFVFFFQSFLSLLEYCYKYLADNTGDMASCMTVYDLKGLDKSLFFGAKKALLKKTMKIMEQHYPERSHKFYILNGRGWVNWLAWPMA